MIRNSIDSPNPQGFSVLGAAQLLESHSKAFALLRFPNDPQARLFVPDSKGACVLRLRPFAPERRVVEIRCSIFDGESTLSQLEAFEDSNRNQAQAETSFASYFERGLDALNALKTGQIEKVVISRIRSMEQSAAQGVQVVERLLESRRDDAVFWLRLKPLGEWIGASPERLLIVESGLAQTDALAGTLARDSNRAWTDKEVREQELVAQDIRSKLRSMGFESWTETTSERVQAKLVHRLTSFEWSAGASAVAHSGEWADRMHPTPAVAGLPLDSALAWIDRSEAHDRRLYAGFVQLIEADRSNAFVALRCAEHTRGGWQAYAGGGWTSDSAVEAEWSETELKTELILNSFESISA
jgi:isochorismate synthase